jgi:hypothetical protein
VFASLSIHVLDITLWSNSSNTTFTFTGNSYTEELSRGTVYGSFEFTETTVTFKPSRAEPDVPSGTSFDTFTLNYQLFENTLTLSRPQGDSGSGIGNIEGTFTLIAN